VPSPCLLLSAADAIRYGVGLAHDVTGRSWSEVSELGTLPQLIDALGVEGVLAALPQAITDRALSHPLEFLQCLDLKTIGIMCMALGYIGISLAPILLILHAMCVARLGYTKWVNIGLRIIWAIYFIACTLWPQPQPRLPGTLCPTACKHPCRHSGKTVLYIWIHCGGALCAALSQV